MNHTRKFFIYTRKSTDTEDRQVRSISDQLAELKELAVKEQIEVVDIFVEKKPPKFRVGQYSTKCFCVLKKEKRREF